MQWLFLTYCVCRFLMKLFTVFFLFFCFQKLELLFTRKRVRLLPTVVDLVAVWLITDRCLPAFPDLFVLGFLQAVLKKSKNAIVWSVSARDSSWCRADLLSAVCPTAPCVLPWGSAHRPGDACRRLGQAGSGSSRIHPCAGLMLPGGRAVTVLGEGTNLAYFHLVALAWLPWQWAAGLLVAGCRSRAFLWMSHIHWRIVKSLWTSVLLSVLNNSFVPDCLNGSRRVFCFQVRLSFLLQKHMFLIQRMKLNASLGLYSITNILRYFLLFCRKLFHSRNSFTIAV